MIKADEDVGRTRSSSRDGASFVRWNKEKKMDSENSTTTYSIVGWDFSTVVAAAPPHRSTHESLAEI